MKEYGRSLRLDDEAEKKLLAGAAACNWRKRSLHLFPGYHHLDARHRHAERKRALPDAHREPGLGKRVIFVPASKTEEGRRRVPMSNRIFDVLKQRCGGNREGWVLPSKRAASAHLTTMAKRFREARVKGGLPEDLVLYCGRHDYGTPDSEENRKPGSHHVNHGPPGCEDCHALSASGTRDRACSARS
jgi:hypothetical protein